MAAGISELMLHDVALVSPEASVQEAACAMAESGCRVVLVGRERVVEGVLTEHDILIRVVAAGLGPGDTLAGSVMSSELFTCREDQPIEEAEAEMAEHRVNQLPVLDGDGHLVGLLPREAARRAAGEDDGGPQASDPPEAAGPPG